MYIICVRRLLGAKGVSVARPAAAAAVPEEYIALTDFCDTFVLRACAGERARGARKRGSRTSKVFYGDDADARGRCVYMYMYMCIP